ncbi:hypothetical protein J6E39_09370 [bacterium]|nr:hypothetical protein [bacterium]
MKKNFALFFILLLFCLPVNSEEFSTSGDMWDNFADQNTYGQKPVTDEEFDKALKKKKIKKNFWGKEIKNKNIPKGEEFRQSNETDFITEVPKELPVLLIPVELIIDESTVLPIGHYQVMAEKKDGIVRIKFYQSGNLAGEIKATETNDDFNQETVNFANWFEHGTDKIRVIFGSLDFNAFADVYINKDSDR